MIVTRSQRFAAVCLTTTALLMSGMNCAIASAAESDPDSTAGASQDNSSSSGSDATAKADRKSTSTTVSGAGAVKPSSTLSAQTNTSAQTANNADTTPSTTKASVDPLADRNVTSTTVSGAGTVKPSSTLSAQTNTSAQTDTTPSTTKAAADPSADGNVTTTTVSGTSPDESSSSLSAQTNAPTPSASSDNSGQAVTQQTTVTEGVEAPSPAANLQIPATPLSVPVDETPSSAASANVSAATTATNDSDTAESAQPSTATTTVTATSDVGTTTTAITEATAPATVAAAPATATVASAMTPTFQYAVAYLLRTLATATDLVHAIMQLPADVRDALGILWIAPDVEGRHALLSTSDGGLLNVIAPSRLQVGSLDAASGYPAAGQIGMDGPDGVEVDGGIVLLAALQPQSPAPALAEATPLDHSVPGLIHNAVTAVVVSVSIWALVYSALPGLGGLLSFGAIGVRIGYRQSSFGIALHSPELARFVRPGPIGVVRTGSLVSVYIRTEATDRTARHLRRIA